MAFLGGIMDKSLKVNGKWAPKTDSGYGHLQMAATTKENGTWTCNTAKENMYILAVHTKASSKISESKEPGSNPSPTATSSLALTKTASQTARENMNGATGHTMRDSLSMALKKARVLGMKMRIPTMRGWCSRTRSTDRGLSTIRMEVTWMGSLLTELLLREGTTMSISRS